MLLVLCAVVGCGRFGFSEPQDRAREFVETLVTTPGASDKLREIARLAPERQPEDLLEGLSAKVTVDFLRARHTQDMALNFVVKDTQKPDDNRRLVTVRVGYADAGKVAEKELLFQVSVERNKTGDWCIIRVTSGH
jgi:hypothetical protein